MLAAEVALVGGHVPDRAVPMLTVVPVHEARDPALRGRAVGERQTRVVTSSRDAECTKIVRAIRRRITSRAISRVHLLPAAQTAG